jgi:hypothetical protein
MPNKYQIDLPEELVSAIRAKLASLPMVMDPTQMVMRPQFANEAEYIAKLIQNDVYTMVAFVPAALEADIAAQQAQSARQAALVAIQSGVSVSKVTE